MTPQEYLNRSFEFLKLAELQAQWYFPIIIITTIIAFLTAYWIYKIKKNSDYILKMKIYEFEKNNPEKAFSELIHDRYSYIRVKF